PGIYGCLGADGQGFVSGGGILPPNKTIRSRDVTDGSSNTMIVGESSDYAYDDKGRQCSVHANHGNSWMSGTNWAGVPPVATSAVISIYNLTTIRHTPNSSFTQAGIRENRGA